MTWESFGVVGFDPWPLFHGQMRITKINSVYILLVRIPRGLQCHIKSWAKNLLIWSDFTLFFSFKVKRC